MECRITSRTPLIAFASVALLSGFSVTGHAGRPESPKDDRAAVWRLQTAYERSNHDPQLLLSFIRALARGGETASAVRYVDEAASHQQWNSRLDIDLGLIFLGNQRCDAAQRRFRSAGTKEAAVRDEILRLGEDAFDRGKYKDALCLLHVSLGFDPASATLYSLAGACHFQLKDAPAAVAEIQRAIQIDPENEQYYLQLAEVFIDFNTPDAALVLLEPAAEKFPESARIRYFAGVACLKLSHYTEAQHYLTESLRLDRRNSLTLHAIADLYEAQQQWPSLLEISKSLAAVSPSQPEAYFYQAEAQFNLSRDQPASLPEVESLLKVAIARSPRFAPSFLLWGRILLARGAYTDSIEKLKRAVELDPLSRAANYTLAMAYKKSGQSQKSSETLKRFQALDEKEKNRSPGERLVYRLAGGAQSAKP